MRIHRLRYLYAFCSFLLVLSLAGCAWVTPDMKSSEIQRSPDRTITYTISTDNLKMRWDDPIAKEVTRRTGVSLRYETIVGDAQAKLDVWLASGDYPDFILLNAQDLAIYARAGAVYELSSLLGKSAPNIMKSFNGSLDLLKDGYGRVYGITVPPTTGNVNPASKGHFHIQYDVLRNSGYPRITSLAQYESLVEKYIERNKFIKGYKAFAFSTIGSGASMFSSFSDMAMAYLGDAPQGPFVIGSDGKIGFSHFQTGFTDFYKFLNRLNRKGLFDEDSFVQNQEAFTQKCSQGNIVSTVAPPEYIRACNEELVRAGMPERQFASFEIVRPGDVSHVQDYALAGEAQYLAISTNVKDPARAVAFLDRMFKLENQILLGWGLEGDYYETRNGKRVAKDDFLKRLQESGPESAGLMHGVGLLAQRNGNVLPDGQTGNILWTPETIRKSYDPMTKDVLTKYGASQWSDLISPGNPLPNMLERLPTEPAEDLALASLTSYHNRILEDIITQPDETKIDGLWTSYLDSLSGLGVQDLEKEMTVKWRRYLENYQK